jgi:hypothetical protein
MNSKPLADDTDLITLYQSDSPLDRARKIFLASGLDMNIKSLILLQGAAIAIEAYRRMDIESQIKEQTHDQSTI